ncbi:MAG: histidine kinase [Chitinophagaceae bacterium]|nr:histidine kinase [Chitinophagaceae bacterium]
MRLLKNSIIFIAVFAPWQKGFTQSLGNKLFSLTENNQAYKINTIYKDKDGFILAGTTNGLYTFNGINFAKVNFTNPNIKDTVTAIFQDNSNQLWVGFKNGKIAKKNGPALQYINPKEGTPNAPITAFLQDNKGNIWFSTNGEGIYYFNNNHLYLIDDADGLSDKFVHTITLTNNGDVLAATDQGINICNIVGAKKNVQVIGPKDGLPDYYITSIMPAGNNTYWIGMQEKGVCLYNHITKQIIIPNVSTLWPYGQVNSILATPNNLWIATQVSGLVKCSKNGNATIEAFDKIFNKTNINNLLQDNEGNIWMTSSTDLISTAGDKLSLLPIYDNATYQKIHTILSDYENNIWVGTDGGLIKYTITNNTIKNKNYRINGLTSKTDITGLYQDKYHNIWISTMGEGIFVLDPFTGNYRNINENPLLKKASVLSINGSGNNVYAGGLEGVATIFEVTDVNNKILNNYVFTNYDNIPNIGNNYIHSIYKDKIGRIWFGTDGKGVTVLQNGSFKNFGKSSGLKDEHVYSFTEDLKGQIWFNTKDAGVYCFDGTTFKNYNETNGISDLKIISLKTDKLGNVILVNENGFDILNPQTGTVSYLNNTQGLSAINPAIESIALDTAQNILFSTEKGIVLYSPIANTSLQPKTIITNVKLFLQDINADSVHQFKYDENDITFYFTGLYFTNPAEVHYQYKLEGRDTVWINTKDQSVPFPNLRPGKYTFHVRSSLNQNFINATEATYSFSIATPLWRKLWFIILCLLLAAGLLYWYIKSRETNLKKLQQLENEKIQFQFQVLRNQVNPHFLFNSFNTLISAIEEDPKMAVDYVEHLSEFFRNIVNYRDKDVISLGEEINLLQTYFYLQQKRYGDSLKLNIHLTGTEKDNLFIPPLTLQLLLENAIKHNAVSKESILTIDIFTQNKIVVKNNINAKINPQSGTGMGLQNIINRYNILSSEAVTVNNDSKFFTVSLPSLKQ